MRVYNATDNNTEISRWAQSDSDMGDSMDGRRSGDGYDAVIVGAGPNGLAAAIALALRRRSTLTLEAADTPGGGARTAELTLPGFRHDVCSAAHPLAIGSPFLKTLPLANYGLEWVHAPYPVAHPLDDGSAVLLRRSVYATADGLGADAAAYRRLMMPLVADWDKIAAGALGPLRLPRNPIAMARFGMRALRSARGLAESAFRGERARALFAGTAAHAILPLEQTGSAAAGLALQTAAHAVGWPMPKRGAQSIADAMTAFLTALGGELATGVSVESADDLPPARATLLDASPRALAAIMSDRLQSEYRRKLERFRHGPGVFKLDWALDAPIPWAARECGSAGTLHLGGGLNEIADAEAAVWRGEHPDKPFVLLTQPSLFDATRAPRGKHTAWAYCHVPAHSDTDMTDRIERQVERFAPGFRQRIIARNAMPPRALEAYNPNYVGGDIGGGANDLRQLFARPTLRLNPYATPVKGVYICSASTPPGAGVHGMCGYYAAQACLRAL